MSEEIKAPILSYDDMRRRADEFLSQRHSSGTIPVPIEEIVEFDLGMDIVPTPGLHRLLDVDGFITSDLHEHWDFAWTRIAAFIAKEFEVSSQVVEKRLEKDGLARDMRDQ